MLPSRSLSAHPLRSYAIQAPYLSARKLPESGRASSTALLTIASLGLIAVPLASLRMGTGLAKPSETFAGAFEGGPTGTYADVTLNNAIQPSQLLGGRTFDVPSGSRPSPLFGAQPFTQKLLLAEEFGTEQPPAGNFAKVKPCPSNTQECTSGPAVAQYLSMPIYPPFTRTANTVECNPQLPVIENCIGRPAPTAPAEGRAGGEDFAHQRWGEFQPQV